MRVIVPCLLLVLISLREQAAVQPADCDSIPNDLVSLEGAELDVSNLPEGLTVSIDGVFHDLYSSRHFAVQVRTTVIVYRACTPVVNIAVRKQITQRVICRSAMSDVHGARA